MSQIKIFSSCFEVILIYFFFTPRFGDVFVIMGKRVKGMRHSYAFSDVFLLVLYSLLKQEGMLKINNYHQIVGNDILNYIPWNKKLQILKQIMINDTN
jgi:hypothetical protein